MPDSTNVTSFHSLSVSNPGFFKQEDDKLEHEAIQTQPNDRRTYHATRLALTPMKSMKSHYVKQLFRLGGILENVEGYPGFYYAGRRVRLSECDVFVLSQDLLLANGTAMRQPEPILGHYQYNVDQERRTRLQARPGPGGLINEPVQRIFDHRLKDITPKNWLHDPFLACVLLSLAQPRLLVTNRNDYENAYVFAADIPSKLLDGLTHPNRSIEGIALPPITYTKVAFEPYPTFTERILIHLLGTEWASGLGLLRQAAASVPSGEQRASSI
ncbi:hypothetical protein IL306_005808 [Fusarium sp. DS 682]|nr:hypothetical protein IL306_005808 [Fusarium sp. DS 682]